MSLPQPAVGRNSTPFPINLPDKETLWQQTYLEAFHKNYESVQRWTRWREDHERVKATLETLPDKLSHDVVIPFGSKALMKAKLVHTNEILTCLGSSYFVKQSAKQGMSLCYRRIKQSEEMLTKLEAERTLLSNRQTLPRLEEAFANDDTTEIKEEYNEEAEAKWRKQHREYEAEYRRQLAELRKNQVDQPPVQTEEDIFRRLDELELEEELNDELERLHAECEADFENNDEEESTGDEEVEDSEEDELSPSPHSLLDSSNSKHSPSSSLSSSLREAWGETSSADFESIKKNRRISFADEAKPALQSAEDNFETGEKEETNVFIRFLHGDPPSKKFTSEDLEAVSAQDQAEKPKYFSPADIYNEYKAKLSSQPKSILKKSSSYPEKLEDGPHLKPMQNSASFGSGLGITFADSDSEEDLSSCQVPRDLSHLPPVLSDVQESISSTSQSVTQETSQRPASRFKLARQRKH